MPRYKVLAGVHADWSPDGTNPNHVYRTGDVVLTRSDLSKMNQPGSEKFQLIPGSENELPPEPKVDPNGVFPLSGTLSPARDNANKTAKPDLRTTEAKKADDAETLNEMTKEELKQYAAGEEIDLAGCSTKQEIVDRIIQSQIR